MHKGNMMLVSLLVSPENLKHPNQSKIQLTGGSFQSGTSSTTERPLKKNTNVERKLSVAEEKKKTAYKKCCFFFHP